MSVQNYDRFLRTCVSSQPYNIMRHDVEGETLWVKRAGPSNAVWRYQALGLVAKTLQMPVLTPVFNPGGAFAIATEVHRLQDLKARGLRVPQVMAHSEEGFVMGHLGVAGQEVPSLGNEMEQTLPRDAQAVLALWKHGLHALGRVHKAGTCLSQAFARNMVRCPDGVIGYIDFEDDPIATLPLPVCQVRDALCYVHSTAWILARADALATARVQWMTWLRTLSPDARDILHATVARMAWAARLPQSRKLGRDVQRIRMAHALLAV